MLHTPNQNSQSSTLILTNPVNQKMEHQLIKWENLSFPSHWVIDIPRNPIQHTITSAHIQESPSSVVISFLPSKQILHTKYGGLSTPSPSTTLCLHPSLQPLASSLGRVPYSIQCLYCHKLVTLSSLSTTTEDNQIQFEHQFHNPRTNFPPPSSTTKDPCPHPQCLKIPFLHDNHMLMITSPSLDLYISPCHSIP